MVATSIKEITIQNANEIVEMLNALPKPNMYQISVTHEESGNREENGSKIVTDIEDTFKTIQWLAKPMPNNPEMVIIALQGNDNPITGFVVCLDPEGVYKPPVLECIGDKIIVTSSSPQPGMIITISPQ